MKIRSVVLSIAFVGLSASTSIYAAPLAVPTLVHAMFGKPKTIRFNLRNDTGASLELKVGEAVMTVSAGKTIALKLPVGTRILTNAATPTHQAGELLAEVTSQIDAVTIGVK